MSLIRIVWNFIKTFWWALVLGVLVILVGWFYLVKRKGRSGLETSEGDISLIGNVVSKVQGAVTDIRVEKAVIGAETSMRREELIEIRKEPDGVKRRDRLASVLKNSL
jgi:hypothetical protein